MSLAVPLSQREYTQRHADLVNATDLSRSLFGGLTTSYTAGGTTVVATVTAPTGAAASAAAAAEAVQQAVIGVCPQANNLLVKTDDTTSDLLVVCGKAYNGTVLSQFTRRDLTEDAHLSKRAITGQDCAVRQNYITRQHSLMLGTY